MTPLDRLERTLPAALDALADPQTPDYLPDILAVTARTRQRPAWTSLHWWLPMDLVLERVPVFGAPWRRLGLLTALLALLLLMALAVGRQPDTPRPAPLFGPAANGFVAYDLDGDLFLGDPITGSSRPLLADPAFDREPTFSRDGTRVGFHRVPDPVAAPDTFQLMVMGADGTEPRAVTPLLDDVSWWDWTPDGTAFVVIHPEDSVQALHLYPIDGSPARVLAPDLNADAPSFRPPGGQEMVFRGDARGLVGIYAIRLDGTGLRELVAPARSNNARFTLREPRYSPDGSTIAFHAWDDESKSMDLFLMDADGTDRREIAVDPAIGFSAWPNWSNDGTRLAIVHGPFIPGGIDLQQPWAILDLRDGSIVRTGPSQPIDGGRVEWAPDDTRLLAIRFEDGSRQLFLDPDGGPWTESAWDSASWPTWQRRPAD